MDCCDWMRSFGLWADLDLISFWKSSNVWESVGLGTALQWNAWQSKGQQSLSWPLSRGKHCRKKDKWQNTSFCVCAAYTAVLDRAIHYLLSQEGLTQEVFLILLDSMTHLKLPSRRQCFLHSYNSALMADHDQDLYSLVEWFCYSWNLLYINLHLTNKE